MRRGRGNPITIPYTNHRGEFAIRTTIPKLIYFGSTEWHPEPQWLLHAIDLDRLADRDFALSGIGNPAPTWTRADLARGLAFIDGVTLYDFAATAGPEEDANNWREYLGRADDLLARLSAVSTPAAAKATSDV